MDRAVLRYPFPLVVLADRCANRSAVLLKGAILGIPSSGGPPIDSRKRVTGKQRQRDRRSAPLAPAEQALRS
jgi:hypothetical protein